MPSTAAASRRPGKGGAEIRVLNPPPKGDVTTAPTGIPVIVSIAWDDGWEADVRAAGEGWTRDAVRVRWVDGGQGAARLAACERGAAGARGAEREKADPGWTVRPGSAYSR